MIMWGLLTIRAVLNFLGCGLLWLIVSQKIAALPLWVCLASHLSKEIYEGCRGCESKGKLMYCLLILLSSKQGRSCCITLDFVYLHFLTIVSSQTKICTASVVVEQHYKL